MDRFSARLWLLAAGLLTAPAWSAPSLAPGQYLTEGGWGSLQIKPAKKNRQAFNIDTMSPSGNLCQLEGVIRNAQARLGDDSQGMLCQIRFEANAEGILVDSNQVENCRSFCGLNAYFERQYLRAAPICLKPNSQRQQFRQLYDQKQYGQALAVLTPLLTNCSQVLNLLDLNWIRNDIALSQYHLNQPDACRDTLKPLLKDAARSDEDLKAELPWMLQEPYLRIIKATRTNLKLCNRLASP